MDEEVKIETISYIFAMMQNSIDCLDQSLSILEHDNFEDKYKMQSIKNMLEFISDTLSIAYEKYPEINSRSLFKVTLKLGKSISHLESAFDIASTKEKGDPIDDVKREIKLVSTSLQEIYNDMNEQIKD